MVGQLLTLPLRIGARGTQLALRTAEGVIGRAATGALQVVGAVRHRGSSSAQQDGQTPTASPSPRNEPDVASAPQRSAVASARAAGEAATSAADPSAPIVSAPQPDAAEPPIAPEPVHVSEEPELVREEAEPGAQDGAGAAVNIRPPWEGYEHMTAREVVARLGEANAAELAAVQLYESSNRSRQTVLEAVERRLKAATARAS